MNIRNLNPEELEQLQVLLNKMNPMHPTDVTYTFDPVNKMIDDIMDEFDFDKVREVMRYLDWKWRGEEVTVKMLEKTARRLLREAADLRLGDYKDTHWEQGIICGTGGFQAMAFCNEDKTKVDALDLKFVLTEWDAQIED
jgi:hypothetical protein